MPSIDLVTLTDRFIAALAAGDWQQLAMSLAPDVRYTETGTGQQLIGAEPYIQLCQAWRQSFPDASATIRATVAEGAMVVQEVLWEGTQAAPLLAPSCSIPASGRHVAFLASIWYTCHGGRINAIHHHADLLTLLGQLGVVEAPHHGADI